MTFNPWTFILEVINFVVLAYVLHRLLYRPLHEAIERRREAVKKATADAEKARTEAETNRKELERKLDELEQTRQGVISQARTQAETERKKILDEVEKTVERRQNEARNALAKEREEMLQKLSSEVITHAVDLAERLLKESGDTTLQAQMVNHLIEALNKIPEDQLRKMRRDWQTENQAWLETAINQDVVTLKRLSDTIKNIAGKELSVNVENNSKLIGGIRLRIGGHLWDASIAGQLKGTQSAQ